MSRASTIPKKSASVCASPSSPPVFPYLIDDNFNVLRYCRFNPNNVARAFAAAKMAFAIEIRIRKPQIHRSENHAATRLGQRRFTSIQHTIAK